MEKEGVEIELEKTNCEKDLGVNIDPTLHFSIQCQKAANKGNQILGLIRRSFKFLDKQMMSQLYKGLVRPHLEHANVVWSPQYAKDAKLLESVQQRATKMVPELKNLEYEERLKAMNLPSLVYRRRRGDLIEAYKYKHQICNVNSEGLLPKKNYDKTRGHAHMLKKMSHRLDLRKKFFSLRVNRAWNKLPEKVAEAPFLDRFKGRVDRHLIDLKFSTEYPLPVVGVDVKETQSESEESEEEVNGEPS